MASDRWMGAGTFARAVGAPPRSVRRWCASGAVAARRRGPKLWQVDLDALKAGDAWQLDLYRQAVDFLQRRTAARESGARGELGAGAFGPHGSDGRLSV